VGEPLIAVTPGPALPRRHLEPAVHGVTGALAFIVDRAAASVGGSCGAGLSLLTGCGRRITSVATDSPAERLNALHDQSFENPCATAWLERRTVASDVGADLTPWVGWVGRSTVGSLLVAPLCTTHRLLGTLLVYARDRAAYTTRDTEALARCATDAAILIDEMQTARSAFRAMSDKRG
jgi:GAF domain-containing protein